MTLIQGTGYWCKIVGDPHPNKFKDGARQWSFDLSVDQATQEKLLATGMKPSYLKDKKDEQGTFLSFTRDEKKTDGTDGKPFSIVDAQNHEWPKDKLIGNGSVLNVKVTMSERTFRGEKFLKPSALAIQVWEWKPFERKSNFEVKQQLNEGEQVPW